MDDRILGRGDGEVPVDGINNATITSTYRGNECDDTMKVSGKTIQTAHVVVSADGKTMRVALTDTDKQGREVHSFLASDKQSSQSRFGEVWLQLREAYSFAAQGNVTQERRGDLQQMQGILKQQSSDLRRLTSLPKADKRNAALLMGVRDPSAIAEAVRALRATRIDPAVALRAV